MGHHPPAESRPRHGSGSAMLSQLGVAIICPSTRCSASHVVTPMSHRRAVTRAHACMQARCLVQLVKLALVLAALLSSSRNLSAKDCLASLKLLLKEYVSPTQANLILFFLGPIITLIFSLLGYAVIPYGPGLAI